MVLAFLRKTWYTVADLIQGKGPHISPLYGAGVSTKPPKASLWVSVRRGGIPLPAQASFLFLYRKTRKGVVGMSITILKGTVVSAPALGKLDVTENGCLVAEDGNITGVFPALPEQYAGAAVEDYGNALILQSFADLHLHAPQYPMLGMGMDLPRLDWLNTYTFPTLHYLATLFLNSIFISFKALALWLIAFLTEEGISANVLLYPSTINNESYPNPFLPFSSNPI